MDENKKRLTEGDSRESKQPVIAIYRNRNGYSVEVNGKEIERLRSFEIRVSNERKTGLVEADFYHAEQYLPLRKEPEDESTMKRFQEELKNVEFSFDENASNEAKKAEKRVQRKLYPRSPRVFPPPFINLPFLNLLVGFVLGVFTGFLLKLILKF